MEASTLQTTQKQSNHHEDKTNTTELTDQEHNDIWTTQQKCLRVKQKRRNLHV